MNLLKRKKELDELYKIIKDVSNEGYSNKHWEKIKIWLKKHVEFKEE